MPLFETDKPALVKLQKLQGQQKSYESKIETALNQARTAKTHAEETSRIKIWFWSQKKSITSLRDTVKNLSDAQVCAAEAQKELFAYQKKLSELCGNLFQLCTSSLAANRSAYTRLTGLLNGASQRQLDEQEKQEIQSIINQLNEGVDIFSRQEKFMRELKQAEQLLTEAKDAVSRPGMVLRAALGLAIFASVLAIVLAVILFGGIART